jgi:hypothetical protein
VCGHIIPPEQPVCICGTPSPLAQYERTANAWIEKFDYGMVMPWIPIAGTLLLIIWIFAPPLSLQYSYMLLFKTYGLVALSTALLSLLESERYHRLGKVPDEDIALGISPLQWFGYIVLVWPVTFPLFLFGYFYKTFRERVHVGAFGTATFMVGLVVLFFLSTRRLYTWPESISTISDPPPAQWPPKPPAPTPLPPAQPLPHRPAPAAITPTPVPPAPSQVSGYIPAGSKPQDSSRPSVSLRERPGPQFHAVFYEVKQEGLNEQGK